MYTIIFRKGTIELEFTTDDKYAVEKQLDLIINQASGYSSKTQPASKPEPQPEPPVVKDEPIEQPKEEIQPESKPIETVQPVQFHHITEEEKQAIIQNAEDVIPQSLDISTVKPLTINALQNPEPEPQPDFDKILNNEMGHQDETPVLKDEKFIQYVEGKAAIEKIDFLVVTAQYLAQYENMNTFNLKHINAKLMQNFTIIVDHTVLQSAISREYITRIQEGSDDVSSEYMLTEKGLRSY